MDEVRFLIAVPIENVENLKMSNDHDKETDMQACELAQSWINGNISHVLLALECMPKKNAIVMALKLCADFNSGEVIRFIRTIEQSSHLD